MYHRGSYPILAVLRPGGRVVAAECRGGRPGSWHVQDRGTAPSPGGPGAGLACTWGRRRGPAPRGGAPPRHAGRPRECPSLAPLPSRLRVPRRGDLAPAIQVWEPGRASVVPPAPDQLARDHGGPG